MAERVRHIAPFINVVFTITSHWWYERVNPVTGEVTIHRGLDIATPNSEPVYSMLTGHVLEKGTDSTQGNYLVIVNDISGTTNYGYATRYMHLASFNVNQGDYVRAGQQVGMEGTTGQSTGIHLHVEMQDISRFNWSWHWSYVKSDYLDPTVFMGIDNIDYTSWIYDGTPVPPTPTRKKKKFPWVLYARKLRNKNVNNM
jgi:murein DD-endopeptidase MepM/ murein hydrolase activator NlpD